GAGDRVTQLRDRSRRLLDVVVLVVRRHRLQPVPELEVDVAGEEFGRCEQQLRVVRVPAQAAGDGEDLHRYSLTRNSSAVSLTSFASAGSPFGSSMFHSIPNCRRSTVVSSRRGMRSVPEGCGNGSPIVPSSSTGT